MAHACSVAQSCLTLWDSMGCSLPDSSVHGIFQEEYWSMLPFPPPEDLPNPGIKPVSPALAGVLFTTVPPGSLMEVVCIVRDRIQGTCFTFLLCMRAISACFNHYHIFKINYFQVRKKTVAWEKFVKVWLYIPFSQLNNFLV